MTNVLIILVFCLYSVKTISRNTVWENNLTLSLNDSKISVNGAKSNVMAGGELINEALKQETDSAQKRILVQSIHHLNRAITAYPDYIDAHLLMGNAQWQYTKSARNAVPFYYNILSINPTHSDTWRNLLFILEEEKEVDFRIQAYQTLLRYNPNKLQVYINLGRAFGREKNDLDNARKYLEQGLLLAPQNLEILTTLGTLYGMQRNYPKAIEALKKSIAIEPTIAKSYVDLGLSYYLNGQFAEAKEAYAKALTLDQTLDSTKFPKLP